MKTKKIHYLRTFPKDDFTTTLAPCGIRYMIYTNHYSFTSTRQSVTCNSCLAILRNKKREYNRKYYNKRIKSEPKIHYRMFKSIYSRCGIDLSKLINKAKKSSVKIENVTCKACLKDLEIRNKN